jgi:N-acetylglucosamine kinase-like BadF-type ATPase
VTSTTLERSRDLVLGVDGGNTKTVAVVATSDGTVCGHAVGGCTDIYGVDTPDLAVIELERTVRRACDMADVAPSALKMCIFCLAGADWPEDYRLLDSGLSAGLDLSSLVVSNDALGPLEIGAADGIGVSVVCGTYLAVGARAPSGSEWHSSFWAEPGGAHGLGLVAIRGLYRVELGLEPASSIQARLLDLFDARSTEELLHRFTRREDPEPELSVLPAARVLLEEAASGDEVALRLVRAHASLLSDYALAAARAVGLSPPFPVTLAGGVFEHNADLLEEVLRSELAAREPQTVVVRSELPPVAGAVLRALREISEADTTTPRERLVESFLALPRSAWRSPTTADRANTY